MPDDLELLFGSLGDEVHGEDPLNTHILDGEDALLLKNLLDGSFQTPPNLLDPSLLHHSQPAGAFPVFPIPDLAHDASQLSAIMGFDPSHNQTKFNLPTEFLSPRGCGSLSLSQAQASTALQLLDPFNMSLLSQQQLQLQTSDQLAVLSSHVPMLPSSQTLIPPQSCIPAPLCHPSALLAPTHPSTPKPYLFDFFQNQQNQQQPLVNLSDLQLDLSTTMEMLASTISQSIPQPLPKSTHAMSASLEKLDPSQISTCPSLSTSSMVSSPADTVKLDPEDGKIHPLHYTPPTRLDPILETILCQEPDSDRRFSCPFSGCTTRFQRRYNLKCHYATIHVNTEKFPCPDCNYKTARRRELKRHIDKVHSGQPLDRRRGKKRVPSLLQTGSPLSSTASVSTTSVASRTP